MATADVALEIKSGQDIQIVGNVDAFVSRGRIAAAYTMNLINDTKYKYIFMFSRKIINDDRNLWDESKGNKQTKLTYILLPQPIVA